MAFTTRRGASDSGDDVVTRGRVAVGDAGEVTVSATEAGIGVKFFEFGLNVGARTDVATGAGGDGNFGGEVLQ